MPTISTRQMHIKSCTSYERDFINPDQAHVQPAAHDVRDLARKYGADAILKYLRTSNGQGE